MSRAFAAGDRVLLVDSKKRRHLITLVAAGSFHTHAGIVAHDDLIGAPDGTTVRTSRGQRLVAVHPTLAEFVLEMPRGAQVIYPKDLGAILISADIFPGAPVLESGIGSGALTTALLRAVGPLGQRRRLRAARRLRGEGAEQRRRVPRRRHAAHRRSARRLRRHRRRRARPRAPRPSRAVAGREARGDRARARRDPARLPADDRPGRAAARGDGRLAVRHDRELRGAPPRLARRRPVGASRSPHGRAHRIHHPRPVARTRGRSRRNRRAGKHAERHADATATGAGATGVPSSETRRSACGCDHEP